ncbi:MAG: hypothetical protein U9Q82_01630 [Chloroflexota bacterium]|nr:hypothetical protein [Chloroflexota bacterium]
MNTIEVVFEGTDVTLKSEELEALGVKRGDIFEVRPSNPVLVPANFSEEERARRSAIIEETWGAWTEEEGDIAVKAIREMRVQWKHRDLS